jgi:hypothetical protein
MIKAGKLVKTPYDYSTMLAFMTYSCRQFSRNTKSLYPDKIFLELKLKICYKNNGVCGLWLIFHYFEGGLLCTQNVIISFPSLS